MDFFDLPLASRVQRVVPKNSFDEHITSKQKKLFTDQILRITWTHKLSPETVNLHGQDIDEIQVFKIELKRKTKIPKVLEIIDKSIPYHIVFWVEFEDKAYLSTSSKHSNPKNEDFAVVDWTFVSEWLEKNFLDHRLNLKKNLDAVFKDICIQLSGKSDYSKKPLTEIVDSEQKIKSLQTEIERLKSKIKMSKQFNEKVELNLELKGKERALGLLL